MDIYFNYENLLNSHNPLVTLEFQDIKNMYVSKWAYLFIIWI